MKKKLLLVLLVLAGCLAFTFGLAACDPGNGGNNGGGGTGEPHEHTYSEEWSYDQTYHWHAATCEHKNEVKDKEKHIFEGISCSVCGYEKELPVSEGLAFELNESGDSYIVAGIGTATDTNIVIPDIYNGKSVTGIKNDAFYENETIQSVVISDSVKNIGSYAFAHCNALTDVTIGSGVETIEKQAFAKCKSLENVIIKDGVTVIGETMFWECPLKKIAIPNSVTVISKNAFRDCASLTEVTIGSGVTNIGELSFYGCKELTEIAIPASVTGVDRYAFGGCEKLQNVALSEGLTTIGEKAFYRCYGFTKITIPDSVTSIGPEAFYYCNKMTDLTLGKGIKNIGTDAFDGCNTLTNVCYTGDMASWCAIEFSNVYASPLNEADNFYVNNDELVRDYIMPDNVKTIGKYAFSQYEGLISLNLNKVTTIADNAFEACWELKKHTFGPSVYTFGKQAFMSCRVLDDVYYTGSLADWCKIDFSDQYSNPLYSHANLYVEGSLVVDLVIPDSITEIKPYSFANCNSIATLKINDNVTKIDKSAFEYCCNLYSVTIGMNVTSIESKAFYKCYKLVEVYNLSSLDIKDNTDNGYIGRYSYDIFTSLSEKSNITRDEDGYIFRQKSPSMPYLLGYIGTQTELVLPAQYNGKNYSIYNYAFFSNNNITSVNFGNGVTSIGSSLDSRDEYGYCFYDCKNLVNIIFGNNVKTIGRNAFGSCDSLTNVVLGDGVTDINSNVFSNCQNLVSITIPSSCTEIGGFAFENTALENVYYTGTIDEWCGITFNDNPLAYGAKLIINNNLVTDVVIDNASEIKNEAFLNYKYLESVTIGNNVENIAWRVFAGCSNLESISVKEGNKRYRSVNNCIIDTEENILVLGIKTSEIPADAGITAIRDYAFTDCEGLTSVIIPDSVTSIGREAFEGCSSLTDITFNGTKAQWEAITKGYNWNILTGNYTIHCTDGDIPKE